MRARENYREIVFSALDTWWRSDPSRHGAATPHGVALVDLLGDDGMKLRHAADRATREPFEILTLDSIVLKAPIPRPPTIRDFYAFEQHVRTARQSRGLAMDPDWYEMPVFYFSNPYCVIGPNVDVPVAPGSKEMDFELEVAAIVGRGGSDLEPRDAEQHIAGFCVMNDWSARDIQRREMKLSMGPVKGKDFATSLGPALVTPDELEPFRKGRSFDLAMTASVNDKQLSHGNAESMYWTWPQLIAHASRDTWLKPGDVLGSGTVGTGCILELTPEAVGGWLKPGDVVKLTVQRLGTLRNTVVPRA